MRPPLGRETADHRHDADGRDRDGAGVDGHAARLRQHLGGPHHAFIVEERLAHAHEHHAAHWVRRFVADLHHLVDDLPGGEVAAEAHPPVAQKTQPIARAHLRTDADDVFLISGPMQKGDADGLERLGSVARKRYLANPSVGETAFPAASAGHARRLADALEQVAATFPSRAAVESAAATRRLGGGGRGGR